MRYVHNKPDAFLFVNTNSRISGGKAGRMIIIGKRIRIPRHYLYEFAPDEQLYIAVPILTKDNEKNGIVWLRC